MITEPDYGSDALNMKTQNKLEGEKYHIKGTKHWQGLTGMADYWLVTSRNINAEGALARDVDFYSQYTSTRSEYRGSRIL